MNKRHGARLSQQLVVLDLMLTALSFYLGMLARRSLTLPIGETPLSEASANPTVLIYLMVLAGFALALQVQGVYEPERALRWYRETVRIIAACVMATVLIAGALYLTSTQLSRLQFGYTVIINVTLLLGVRYTLRGWHRQFGFSSRLGSVRILLVGAGDLGRKIATTLEDYGRWGYELVGLLDDDPNKADMSFGNATVLGRIDDLETFVDQHRIDDVWIALPRTSHARVGDVVARLSVLPVRVHIVPDYFPLALVHARPRDFGGLPLIALRDSVIHGVPRAVKRAFDIAVSSAVLLLAAPVIVVLAVLIRLDSRGAALFRQARVGENGHVFQMLKLRTMVLDAEQQERQLRSKTDLRAIQHKVKHDPRVTRLGAFIRRHSLDELPQLINVLMGDMSLVGPRPEMPWLVAKYEPWQRRRLAVPQGMTGWWQVTGRSDKPMHLNTDKDLYYVYHYSLWLDLEILARTVRVLFRQKGAF